ncbi:acyltransferase [Streptomyces sp. NBC_00102]|uniref:acyltransferase family protein n=1 Tax=Streptomyces sp. NBC_00102 TaxID=2975652 RepID=UPI00225938D3|nr:acyltransferase [Streptomyces sp. NBC_00102]MCX5397347.1 acyltransferase family protein [Streptomyces sp. NBC_00102]
MSWNEPTPSGEDTARLRIPAPAAHRRAPAPSLPYATGPGSYLGDGTTTVPGVPAPAPHHGRHAGGPAVPEAPVEAGEPASAAPKRPVRDRYLDVLRSVALVRVVVYHLFGWAWLTVLFPSMGVMFTLAGSLMARSLARPAWSVIRSRVRRLLPPMWLFSVVALPMMFWLGWKPVKEEGLWWFVRLASYVLPVGSPPYPEVSGSDGGWLETSWADQAAGPLWYIRAYLWFVIASPLLLKAFRKMPWATMLAPIGLTAVFGTGLVTIPGATGEGVVDFTVFASCWILGFAHHDGVLKRVPRYLAVSSAAIIMGFGLWWASGHLTEEGWNLDEIPLAQATWSFGFCMILLQYAPSWEKLPGRLAPYDGLVTLANNRAVTIYIWHNLLLMATVPLIDQMWKIGWVDEHLGAYSDGLYTGLSLILIWPLIGLAILAFGWVEDVAAKRRPRLWPSGKPARPTPVPASPSGGHRH